jgi:hypothetical protein
MGRRDTASWQTRRLVSVYVYMEPWSECNCSSRAAVVDAAPHLRGFVVQDCARHWLSWPIPRGSKVRFRTTAGSSQGSSTTSCALWCSLSPSLASPPVWRAPGTTLARQDPPQACPNQSEPVAARGALPWPLARCTSISRSSSCLCPTHQGTTKTCGSGDYYSCHRHRHLHLHLPLPPHE